MRYKIAKVYERNYPLFEDMVFCRLYVNVQNSVTQKLYEDCGYKEDGQAYFMEKY